MRKFVLLKLLDVHVWPHVSDILPRVYVASVVLRVVVDLAVVHVVPPSHESCTQIFGEPLVASARASRRT
jgi:hypothetical protein